MRALADTIADDGKLVVKRLDLIGDDPEAAKARAANMYGVYMDGAYCDDRKKRWSHWLEHYQHSRRVIGGVIHDQREALAGLNIELVGLSPSDFVDGSMPLHERISPDNDMTFGEALLKARTLIFRNLVSEESEQALDVLEEYMADSDTKRNPKIILANDDLTDGLAGVCESVMRNDGNGGADPERILQAMEHFYNGGIAMLPQEISKDLPERKLGFSLMVQTGTLAPLVEWYSSILIRKLNAKEIDMQKYGILENKMYEFLQKFNNWLIKHHLDQWFINNPRGSYTIITDKRKRHYIQNDDGTFNEEVFDRLRSYYCLNQEFSTELQRHGYHVQKREGPWYWRDEPDHAHTVCAFTVEQGK
jgi:hypothetical protein